MLACRSGSEIALPTKSPIGSASATRRPRRPPGSCAAFAPASSPTKAAAAGDIIETGAPDDQRIERVFDLNMGIYKLKYGMNLGMNLMYAFATAAALGVGGWFAATGRIDVGTVEPRTLGQQRESTGFSSTRSAVGDLQPPEQASHSAGYG